MEMLSKIDRRKRKLQKINSPYPSGIVFPHHKSLLLNVVVNDVVGCNE